MILILGGTTEGRLAVRVCDAAGKPYWYSTRGDMQQIECSHGEHITGAMDFAGMSRFCAAHGVRLLIDAAHPFAVSLHETVAAVAESLDIPAVRVERVYPARDSSAIWCEDYADAIARLEAGGVERLLALTGVQTISKLEPYWKKHDCYFRILRREASCVKAFEQGFDPSRLVYYQEEDESALIERLRPGAILTKESGASGGFMEKLSAASAAGIPVYAVKRPALPLYSETVTGEHGLRRAVEQLLPGFFDLRSGFTTGACATAASKAALMTLLGMETGGSVEIEIPDGERLSLKVCDICRGDSWASAAVVKEAGDDPDVTSGVSIVAKVAFAGGGMAAAATDAVGQAGSGSVAAAADGEGARICFLQGEGVGRVTLPGLGIEIGQPAINPVPRKMIIRNLRELYAGALDVTISVPGGRELALKTFNPKLGIEGGISIIGTSGIVRPFSNEAFVEAIRREAEVARAVGAGRLIINSGAKSEAYLKARFPQEPPQAFVHYGNFIGETLKIAAQTGFEQVTMGIMMGKAVKLAEGHLDTHSKNVVMNKYFLGRLALEAGCTPSARASIDSVTLARELWDSLSGTDLALFCTALLELCHHVCQAVYPQSAGHLQILLIAEDGTIFE